MTFSKHIFACLFAASLAILSPLLSLILCFPQIKIQNYIKVLVLSNFFAVFGFSLVPWGDGYIRYKSFISIEYFSYQDYLLLNLLNGDIIFAQISYLIYTLGLEYQWVQYVFVFIGSFILISTFNYARGNKNFNLNSSLTLSFLLLINIFGLANNQRYMLSTSFSLLACILFFNKRRITSLFFWMCGIASHFYAIGLFIVLSIIKFLPRIQQKNLYLVVGIFGGVLLVALVNFIVPILVSGSGENGFIIRKVLSYFILRDNLITGMVKSPQQAILALTKILPFFIFVIIFSRMSLGAKKDANFLFGAYAFLICIIFFYSVFLRFSYFFLMLSILLLASKQAEHNLKRIHYRAVLFSAIIFFIFSFAYFERILWTDSQSIFDEKLACAISSSLITLHKCAYEDTEIKLANTNFIKQKELSTQRRLRLQGL